MAPLDCNMTAVVSRANGAGAVAVAGTGTGALELVGTLAEKPV